jgi:hypothetical protein
LVDISRCALQESFTEMFEEKNNIDIKKKSKEIMTHRANQLFFKIG